MKKKETELDKLAKKDVDESKKKEEQPEESEKKFFEMRFKRFVALAGIVFFSFLILLLLTWLFPFDKKTPEEQKVAVIDEAKKEKIAPELILYSFDPFFVPLVSSPKEKNFLKIGLDAELSSAMLKKEIESNLPEIRSSIFKTITSKSVTDIKNPEGKSRLKNEITAKINSLLQSGKVKELYFSQFIIQ